MPANRSDRLVDILMRIYRSKKFDSIRSEVLESIVYSFGPVTSNLVSEAVT